MTRNEQIALYTEAFRASRKADHQRGAAQLACMMDRGTRYEDFEALLARLTAKADAAWAAAKAATTNHEIILEAAKAA
ncbi:hypothetical protein [Bradyrhizobium sp. JR18.2]|uniref:hypothetical protein n=1 Tax=Bradyrhizobium sp. JR18.2 TaxID=3156369 RepID=UPI0033937FC9